MISRENTVILASLLVAIVAAALVDTYADLPYWVSLGVLIGLGVVVPTLLNEYLGRRGNQ